VEPLPDRSADHRIIAWNDARYIRVSCHLYNTRREIDYLVQSLGQLLEEERR
jgi:selenocysteine lyase/cysteine desulfurase